MQDAIETWENEGGLVQDSQLGHNEVKETALAELMAATPDSSEVYS